MKQNPIKRAVCLALLIVCLGAAALNLLLPFAYYAEHGPISIFYCLQLERSSYRAETRSILGILLLLAGVLTILALLYSIHRVLRTLDREGAAPGTPKSVVPSLKLDFTDELTLGVGPALGLFLNAAMIAVGLFVFPLDGYPAAGAMEGLTAVPLIGMVLLVSAIRLCKALNEALPCDDPAEPETPEG